MGVESAHFFRIYGACSVGAAQSICPLLGVAVSKYRITWFMWMTDIFMLKRQMYTHVKGAK